MLLKRYKIHRHITRLFKLIILRHVNPLNSNNSNVTIHPYNEARSTQIADLFHLTIHAIDPAFYSEKQTEAWAPTPPDYVKWENRLKNKKPWLAIQDDALIGFIELEEDGHIDCFYVHPEHQGKGIAKMLYAHLLQLAQKQEMTTLLVEASKLARPFFEKRGFEVLSRNEIERKGEVLINYNMKKQLI